MNEVMTIKRKHEELEAQDMDCFMFLFQTDEIKERRAARMRWDAMRAEKARKQRETMTKESWEKHERALEKAHQLEVADTAASVAGGLTMAASLLALAMLV